MVYFPTSKLYIILSENENLIITSIEESEIMDVYRGKKVLLGSGSLTPACILVQHGKIVQVHEGIELPLALEHKK